MQFGNLPSSLPPIDDARRQMHDKAAQKAAREAQEIAAFKTMTLEQKKKQLEAYNPQQYFTKGSYIDAQDTTNVFIMAKVIVEHQDSIEVNYDGWSERWNVVSRSKSKKASCDGIYHVE